MLSKFGYCRRERRNVILRLHDGAKCCILKVAEIKIYTVEFFLTFKILFVLINTGEVARNKIGCQSCVDTRNRNRKERMASPKLTREIVYEKKAAKYKGVGRFAN